MDYLYEKRVVVDDVTKDGFVTDRNGTRYYENNEMKKGWLSLDPDGDGTFEDYYFNEETGYAPKECVLMKFQGEGEMKYLKFGANGHYEGIYSGIYNDGSGTLHIVDGKATTGFKENFSPAEGYEEGTYYFDKTTGYMATGITKVDGIYYDFGEKGKLEGKANGLVKDTKGTRYFEDGALVTGYKTVDHDSNAETANIEVYFDPNNDGYMVVSDAIDVEGNGIYTKFDSDGKKLGIATGLYENSKGLRYFDDEGKLVTGETKTTGENAATYYFDPERNGYAYRSKWYTEIEGEGDEAHTVKKYYYKSDGTRAENETLTIEDIEYTFDEKGNIKIDTDTSNNEE